MSDLLKTLDALKKKLSASATASGASLTDKVEEALKTLEEASNEIVEKLDIIKAKAKADAEAKAQAKADAEAEAKVEFIKWLNDNEFVGFTGKGGRIACLLEAKLYNDAKQEAHDLFGLLQAAAKDCPFDLSEFNNELFIFQHNRENKYALIVYLNIKGGLRLEKFGGREVGTHFCG